MEKTLYKDGQSLQNDLITQYSEEAATQELHTQSPTNSSISFRQLEEPINQSGKQRLAPTPQSFIKSIRNSSKHQEQL